MSEKFKIMSSFIKDMSSETPSIETYLFVKEKIQKYHLDISINSNAIKNHLIEIDTSLKFEDKEESEKKSNFEIVYTTIIKIDDNVKDKKELQKIILCDAQIKIYPKIEKALLSIIHNSGFENIQFKKKIDFETLFKEKFI
jgi:preprotein translocase subunit SecB